MNNFIEAKDIIKNFYPSHGITVEAVRGISMKIKKGTFVAICGPSGCGKSTFLHLLGGMLKPTSGEFKIGDIFLHQLSENQLANFRRKQIGFVFQRRNLFPSLTVFENLLLSAKIRKKDNTLSIHEMLKKVGLEKKENRLPSELSGGEQQRVAIIRALLHQPDLLLLDEPTGNLDSESTDKVLDLIRSLQKDTHQTTVMITHNPEVADITDQIFHIKDGCLCEEIDKGAKG